FDVFAGKKSAQIREILISESAWEEMTCLFAPSLPVEVLFLFYYHSPGVYYAAVSFTWCPFKKLTLQLSDSITIIG
ncbi:hypothetical protein ACP8ZU_23500, partial [Escherichia coli]